jgi:D-glycero-D-manno-heptose 1,7-bisphosphate phosphatase
VNAVKLIILDRDGTVNEDRDDYVKSPDEWVPIPGSLEAVARLNHAGWHTVIATNQSGLGRGLFDMAALNAMHLKMNQQLAGLGGRIDAVFFCPHAPDEGCSCRKPAPGLIELIGERYGVHLEEVPVVGDSLRDLQAGQALGCPLHLVRTGKSAHLNAMQIVQMRELVPNMQVHADLAAFAESLIRQDRIEHGATGENDTLYGQTLLGGNL